MTNLVYLLVPLTVAAVVVAVLYWRDRRPTSVNEGIEQFRDGLRALAPESGPRMPHQSGQGPSIYSSYGVPEGHGAPATATVPGPDPSADGVDRTGAEERLDG